MKQKHTSTQSKQRRCAPRTARPSSCDYLRAKPFFTPVYEDDNLLIADKPAGVLVQDESGKISDSDFTLDFILDERARELYLESVRRTDLIRFNKFVSADYIWQWKGGVLDGRAVNKKYNIYPIPDTDLTANPNLHNPLY